MSRDAWRTTRHSEVGLSKYQLIIQLKWYKFQTQCHSKIMFEVSGVHSFTRSNADICVTDRQHRQSIIVAETRESVVAHQATRVRFPST